MASDSLSLAEFLVSLVVLILLGPGGQANGGFWLVFFFGGWLSLIEESLLSLDGDGADVGTKLDQTVADQLMMLGYVHGGGFGQLESYFTVSLSK